MKTTEISHSKISQNDILRENAAQTPFLGRVETTKLSVTAEQINNIIEMNTKQTCSNFTEAKNPTWYRICTFTLSSVCCGRCVVQFYWSYARENTCMFLFKVGCGFLNIINQFTDNRVKKIRVVRDKDNPVSIGYIDILIDNINIKEVFEINIEMFNTSATAYAGTIETTTEGYVIDEYDIT